MMPTAFLIYGHIGVGKTTVARQLEEQHAAVRFTSDEWVVALYGSEEGSVANFATALDRVEAVMEPLWTRWLQAGVDVVLDLGFWSRTKRDHVREAVVRSGGIVELVSVRCARDVAWRRVEQRNGQLGGSSVEVSRETFDVLRSEVEELAADELHREVSTDGTKPRPQQGCGDQGSTGWSDDLLAIVAVPLADIDWDDRRRWYDEQQAP